MAEAIRLLVVEDETLIHLILEEELGDHGFDLVIKSNGQTALDELDTNAKNFAAVLTDIRLGTGPCGWDVARRARELVPTMPVVYISGDSVADWAFMGVPDSIMISKPFVVMQIITAISTLLNTNKIHGLAV